MLEIWKAVPGYEGLYQVSSRGRVKSLPKHRKSSLIMKPGRRNGRPIVLLCKQGKYKCINVSLVVALAFLGPPEGRMVRHWDDDPLNNDVGNLLYGTAKDNSADAIRNGRSTRGSKNAMAVLHAEQVLAIKQRLGLKEAVGKLAKEFGVCSSAISEIKAGRNWGWLLEGEKG